MFSSVSFAIDWEPERRTLIPLMTGLVVSEAVDAAGGATPSLKWPNDLLVGSRKAGGVLVELEGDRMTVGCGLNLWWRDPRNGATSVFGSDPGPTAALDLAVAWVGALFNEVDRGPESWRKQDYVSACATLGQLVEWADGDGRAIGIDDSGALVVDTDDGPTIIHAGDVHLRGSH
jgi:BirA family biotin operon repressor/biotin-[acetyl-CoA-carboxylase] ligase